MQNIGSMSSPLSFLYPVLKFSEVNFKQISDIPLTLLREIATCFNGKKEICRLCFYEERVMSVLVQATNKCDNGEHQWNKPLLVIPGLCLVLDFNEISINQQSTVLCLIRTYVHVSCVRMSS